MSAMMKDDLSYSIIGAAMEVHRAIGPGMLESVYERCLAEELNHRKIKFQRQVEIPIEYKGLILDCGFRLDFSVENQIVLEFKAVEQILPIHEAQLITYLKMSRKNIGLIINFNVLYLKEGIKRLVL